jgi:uncharacterized coiled-coil DUF342 family protein
MTWEFEFENIGGILDGAAHVEPGMNVIRASNWQGKSSFIEALQTALGVKTPLTEGKDSGYVRYRSPDFKGRVELDRSNGTVEQSGPTILSDDYEIIRTALFACLGEGNEVRRTVREGDNLEAVMLRPLDFENIDQQIATLVHNRDQVEAEIDRAEQAKKQLPAIETRLADLESELDELEAKRDRLLDEEETGKGSDESSARTELTQVESDHNRVQNRIEQLEQTIERTESNLSEKEVELDAIDVPDNSEIQSELTEAQSRLQELKRDKTVLESIHSATEMVLTEDRLDLITEVDRELTGDSFVCWTCGSDTDKAAVEEQVNELREKILSIQAKAESQQSRVEEWEAKRETIAQDRRRKEALETDIAQLNAKLSEDRQSLETARERATSLEERIKDLSVEVNDRLDRVTEVESEIKYRKAEIDDVESDQAELQQRAEQLESLQSEREALQSEIESLRDRKETVRRHTREAFDEAMAGILDRFETGFETARLTSDFDLVVARDGRETQLDALSEGEIELLGFVAALAGYEAFDVDEISPLLLVDQVGGLAEHNLSTLVDYLRTRTDYLVFTAYPEFESTAATVINPGSWTVASAD